MPFGKGIRMCLGMNLALIEMKLVIANLYWHFNSRIDPNWCEVVTAISEEPGLDPAPLSLGSRNVGDNRTDEEKMTMYDSYTLRPVNEECWLEWYLDK